MPPHSKASEPTAFRTFLAGIGSMIALAGLAASQSWWSNRAFQAAFAMVGLLTLGAGILSIRAWGIEYRGWEPYPTWEESQERKKAAALRERQAAQNLNRAIDIVMDELGNAARVLADEIKQEHLYGANLSTSGFSFRRRLLSANVAPDSLAVLDEAFRLLEDYNTRKSARNRSAETDEIFEDPAWRKLSRDELDARRSVRTAVDRGWNALRSERQRLTGGSS